MATLTALLAWSVCVAGYSAAPAPQRFDTRALLIDLFEGDIAGIHVKTGASADDIEKAVRAANARNGIVNPSGRWPGGIMYYDISPSFDAAERAEITKAVAEFNTKTAGLRAVQRTSQRDYVYITRGAKSTGCYSYVGKQSGRQTLNLEVQQKPGDPHCMHHGIIVHEMMHAAGFWHEQSRSDRDSHVEINWNNIDLAHRHNFNAYSVSQSTFFGVPYDLNSLMHYGQYDFAKDRKVWTIRGKGANQNTAIGQRVGLSENDIKKIDAMYPKKA